MEMSKVSVIIPCRGEQYEVSPGVSVLQRTVEDVFEKAAGDIEVIVIFDGPPYQKLKSRNGLIVLNREWAGTKIALNIGANLATGKWLMKLDAHCMVSPGFDGVLQAEAENNQVITPRMYVLNAEEWKWQDERFYDYFYLPCPLVDPQGFRFQAGCHWKGRTQERLNWCWDDNMKLHGSCWFMSKLFYWNCLEGLDPDNGAGSWNGEDIEISLKTWLGPWEGKLLVNKNAWYAHMHRGGQRPREFGVSWHETKRSSEWTANYWMKNSWEKQVNKIEWLIEKFSPVPTWPENWKELHDQWKQKNSSITNTE